MSKVRVHRAETLIVAAATSRVRVHRAELTASTPTARVRVHRAEVTVPTAAQDLSRVRIHRASLEANGAASRVRVHRAQVTVSAALIASAGPDQSNVEAVDVVTLNGHGSSGAPSVWAWTQTGGPAVILSDADAPVTSFVAPATVPGATLTFTLTVGDGTTTSAADVVSVSVLPCVEWRAVGGKYVGAPALSRAALAGVA